jgi:hypothetical protein
VPASPVDDVPPLWSARDLMKVRAGICEVRINGLQRQLSLVVGQFDCNSERLSTANATAHINTMQAMVITVR